MRCKWYDLEAIPCGEREEDGVHEAEPPGAACMSYIWLFQKNFRSKMVVSHILALAMRESPSLWRHGPHQTKYNVTFGVLGLFRAPDLDVDGSSSAVFGKSATKDP